MCKTLYGGGTSLGYQNNFRSTQDLLLDVAVSLYQRQLYSLAKAARFAGLNRLEFQGVLAERHVPIRYDLSHWNYSRVEKSKKGVPIESWDFAHLMIPLSLKTNYRAFFK